MELKSLVNQTCDVAAMSRPMKDSEFGAAAGKGIQPVAHVVALDGLPILIHPSNPVGNLTVEQVRMIFKGEISNWKEVGGPDRDIVTISRDTNSGTYETFAKLVMNKEKIGIMRICWIKWCYSPASPKYSSSHWICRLRFRG